MYRAMRGVVIGRSPNGLALIGSLLNRTPQLSYFKPKSRQIQVDSADNHKERISKYPYGESVVCTREQKEELARIARKLPENAPDLLKKFVQHVLLTLQRNGWDFEDKICIMHEVVSPSRETCHIQEDYEGKERIRESALCTREQKEELARIARTLPEDATDAAKRLVEYVALALQGNDGWDFEEKMSMLHMTIKVVVSPSRGCTSKKDYEGKERIRESLVRTRAQKEELARIAATLPESAPHVVKRFADLVALTVQRCDRWCFEDKIYIMRKTIKELSQGYK